MHRQQKKRDDILPIDRLGWGWVVVCAAALLFALYSGGFKCSGVILVELTAKYDGVYSQATLLWVLTLKYIIAGLIGPLGGLLIVKLTHRVVAMVGTLFMAVAWIGLAYSNSMVTMIAFYSVPAGIGNGMLVMVCFLVSGQYFIKHKALAVGIVAGGSGIGTLTLPYLMRAFYDNFDFGGASLLYGAICLQCMVLASLLRPITYYERLYASELSVIGGADSSEDTDLPVKPTDRDSLTLRWDGETTKFLNSSSDAIDLTRPPADSVHILEPNTRSGQGQVRSRSTRHHLVGDPINSAFPEAEPKKGKGIVPMPDNVDKERFNLKVLLMPKFWMVGIAMFLFALGLGVVYQGVPALGEEEGISKDTIALLMLLGGVLEIPCRVGNGYLADRRVMSSLVQFSLGMFFAGFMSLLCAIISGLSGIILVMIGMSVMGISVLSLVPLVFLDLLGPENLTSAMGVQFACESLGFLVSSYLTGLVYNTLNSWRMVYYYVAGVMILASIVTWPYCFYTCCQKYSSKSTPTSDNCETADSTL